MTITCGAARLLEEWAATGDWRSEAAPSFTATA